MNDHYITDAKGMSPEVIRMMQYVISMGDAPFREFLALILNLVFTIKA